MKRKHSRRHDMDGFSAKDYFASHHKRASYKKARIWTPRKKKLFKTGLELIEDGVRIEVVVSAIRRFGHV